MKMDELAKANKYVSKLVALQDRCVNAKNELHTCTEISWVSPLAVAREFKLCNQNDMGDA